MNKNFKLYLSIWSVLLAIFNIAVFVSPSETSGFSKFGGAFWVGYIFITLAFIGQLAVSFIVFKAENLQKLFYNIPLIRISYTGLVLTLIFGTLCMAIPNLPNWIGIILCFAVLGFNAISILKANFAADAVSEIDGKIKTQTAFIKNLTVDAETLISKAQTDEIKAECNKVYEAVRYSDPMSCSEVLTIEKNILIKMSELKLEIDNDNLEKVKDIAPKAIDLIRERNAICKANK